MPRAFRKQFSVKLFFHGLNRFRLQPATRFLSLCDAIWPAPTIFGVGRQLSEIRGRPTLRQILSNLLSLLCHCLNRVYIGGPRIMFPNSARMARSGNSCFHLWTGARQWRASLTRRLVTSPGASLIATRFRRVSATYLEGSP